jgi:16S rRNA C967 or C1407 C5-methylase (RsmB/RsmF family)
MLAKFPPAFLQFLTDNGVDPSVYAGPAETLPRFVRVNPRSPISLEDLQAQFTPLPVTVPQLPLPGFWQLPHDAQLANSPCYKSGQVYGMDLASGIAAHALDPQPDEHVLDLCCAPGAKLCLLSDLQHARAAAKGSPVTGSVTGVDANKERIAAAQTLMYCLFACVCVHMRVHMFMCVCVEIIPSM